jgi:hypothetical protein
MRAVKLFLLSLLVIISLGSCWFTPSRQIPAPLKSPVTIRAEVTGYGLILLPVRVNASQPKWFALDSGASFPFVIDARLARDSKLKLEDNLKSEGGAGPGAYEVAMTRGVSIDLGGLEFGNQTAAVIALGSLEALTGKHLDGLIGRDLFTRYVVEIDYIGQKISLYDPQTYTYSGNGASIPLTMRGDYLFVPAKIEMPGRPNLNGQFLVDTGGALMTAVLTTTFAQSKNLPAPSQRTISDRSLSGLGGETKLLVTRATSFSLGNLAIRDPVIYLSQDKGGALSRADFDGLIGGEILRRFKVIFDYARGRLILEPNLHYREPFEYDMSGIRLRAEGSDFRTFRVYRVLEKSPAAAAGLHEGDVLTAIDGVPASSYTLDELYQMLKRPGREYELSIRRGSDAFSAKLTMVRLI